MVAPATTHDPRTLAVWAALLIALLFSHAPMYGPQAAFLSELFGTRVRYSGASLGDILGAAIRRRNQLTTPEE